MAFLLFKMFGIVKKIDVFYLFQPGNSTIKKDNALRKRGEVRNGIYGKTLKL